MNFIHDDSVNIICPKIKADYVSPLMEVTNKSPALHRRAVWKLARYFKLESGYDFVQYGHKGYEKDVNAIAYLWPHPYCCHLPKGYGYKAQCIGACCFRWRVWDDTLGYWALQWVWIHPYFRRKGMLASAWPTFVAKFGAFEVEGPLSASMDKFIKKTQTAPIS